MVQLHGLIHDPPRAMLVYEYAPEGSLLSLLECNSPSLTLRRRMELAVDIADAMEFVASKNMVHRDLRA